MGLGLIAALVAMLIFEQKKHETKRLLLIEPLLALSESYRLIRYLGNETETRKLFGLVKANLFQHESLIEDLLRQVEYRPDGHADRAEVIDCKSWSLLGETKQMRQGKRTISVSLAGIKELSQKVEIDHDLISQAELLGKNGYLVLGITTAVIHSTKNKNVIEEFIGAVVLEPVFKKNYVEHLRQLSLTEKMKLVTVADRSFASWVYNQLFKVQPNEIATTESLGKAGSMMAWEAQAKSAEVIAEADLKTRYHLARYFLHKDSPSLFSSNPEDKQLPLKTKILR